MYRPHHQYRPPLGHTLMELMVAMVASAVLLAGLGSVMLIARQIALIPSAATAQNEAAAAIVEQMVDLRFATIITGYTPKDDSDIPIDMEDANVARRKQIAEELMQAVEFVVPDRNNDGRAERIRFDWPLHPDPSKRPQQYDPDALRFRLYRSVFLAPGDPLNEDEPFLCDIGGRPARTWPVAETPLTSTIDDAPVLAYKLELVPDDSSQPLESYSQAVVRLLTWPEGMETEPESQPKYHARVESALPLLARPKHLAAYWRADFDTDPTAMDIDGSGESDWDTSDATFVEDQLREEGVWLANGDLATNPPNDFTSDTVVEARCKIISGSVPVLQINADRQGGTYLPLIVRMEKRADGSQTLTLDGVSSTAQSGSLLNTNTVDYLPDDYVRFRLVIRPVESTVSLYINAVDQPSDVSTFEYTPIAGTSTDRCVKIGGNAIFDYVDVRVAPN